MNMKTTQRDSGYIALVAVLIGGALMLVSGLAASRFGVESSTASSGEELAALSRALADACAEEALMRLRSDLAYAGNETIAIGGDTCAIGAIDGTGPMNRSIDASARVSGYTQHVRLDVATVTPVLNIRSWKSSVGSLP